MRNIFTDLTALSRLILANLVVFVLIKGAYTVLFLFNGNMTGYDSLVENLSVPSSFVAFLHRPWTIITYMFVHKEFFHILFNMLTLYWFGQILEEFIGEKRLTVIYFLGGICGALMFMLSFNLFPAFNDLRSVAYTLGASAGILAVVVAAATLLPDYTVRIVLLGPVKLKWIALVLVMIDLLSIGSGNAGGHLAHLGGALFGFIYIKQVQRGTDLGAWLISAYDFLHNRFFKPKGLRTVYRGNAPKSSRTSQAEVDMILDKIAKSGYDSLSKEDKEKLFRASKEE